MPTITCQYCGIEFQAANWDVKRGRKYCSRECYWKDSKNRITKDCRYCNSPFEVIKSQKDVVHYCCKECRLADGWIPSDPSKHSIFVCEWCGQEFEEWTYRQPRFCSNQCRSEFAARQPKPSTIKPEIHITRICKSCGKEYETTTHQVRLRGSNFCSPECRDADNGMRMRGDGNPNYNGGHIDDYGPNWCSQKRKARKRDRYICQCCERKKRKGERALDVHHIVKAKLFNGDFESANHLSNLITLCRQCHALVECGQLECPPCPTPMAALATVP